MQDQEDLIEVDHPSGDGIHRIDYLEYKGGICERIDGGVIEEGLACISVNGRELATFMCSPMRLEELGIGFLRSEGFIAGMGDVRHMRVTDSGTCVDIWLNKDIEVPERAIVTAGCGGGITFDDLSKRHEPLQSNLTVTAEQVCALMKSLMQSAEIYNQVRGIHTSAMSDGERLAFVAEDVGRHNTIDRLWGQALMQDYDTRDRILLASGRISSEMLSKAMKMGAPIVVSRTSPTSLSVRLARAWNITVIGYCRGNTLRVYAGEPRLIGVQS